MSENGKVLIVGGKLVLRSGELALHEDCCCIDAEPVPPPEPGFDCYLCGGVTPKYMTLTLSDIVSCINVCNETPSGNNSLKLTYSGSGEIFNGVHLLTQLSDRCRFRKTVLNTDYTLTLYSGDVCEGAPVQSVTNTQIIFNASFVPGDAILIIVYIYFHSMITPYRQTLRPFYTVFPLDMGGPPYDCINLPSHASANVEDSCQTPYGGDPPTGGYDGVATLEAGDRT